jgi:hypothetical protein
VSCAMKLRNAPLLNCLCLPFFLLALTSSQLALSSTTPALQPEQHQRLRYKLETLFNEQDLMIRNQKVDHSDVAHQRKELEALKVFERIPYKADIAGLQENLRESSKRRGLKLITFKALQGKTKASAKRVPESLYTDDPAFRLTPAQLAEEVPFRAVLQGDKPSVLTWMESWPDDQLRLTEPRGGNPDSAIKGLPNGQWEIQAHAFRFRDIKFPTLKARDPIELLRREGVRTPETLAQTDPLLWSFVTRIRELAPQARPLYHTREDLLLNSAIMSFFVSKAVPRGRATASR